MRYILVHIKYCWFYTLNFRVLLLSLHPNILDVMNRIKEILDEKGIKQTWLANNLDKSYNVVNGYVNNARQPSVEVLYRIAELLNVSVKDLLIDNKELEENI